MATEHSISDEIDLIDMMETLWQGKWWILSITIISTIAGATLHFVTDSGKFTATTLITPISQADFEPYRPLATLDMFDLSPEKLQRRYFEQLQNPTVLGSAIADAGLVPSVTDRNGQEFNNAINNFAANINVEPVEDNTSQINGQPTSRLIAVYHDEAQWLAFLHYLDQRISDNVQQQIEQEFLLRQGTFDIQRKFELEDIDTRLRIANLNYQNETTGYLTFLQEQASIARAADLPNHSLLVPLDQNSAYPTNPQAQTPPYLHGYLALEAEIAAIENRENTGRFVKEFNALQRARQTILQDQTPERARALFAQTPIQSDQEFRAVHTYIGSTRFEYQSGRLRQFLAAAAISGFGISLIFVLISNAIGRRRSNQNSTLDP